MSFANRTLGLIVCLAGALTGCSEESNVIAEKIEGSEGLSLLGDPLVRPELAADAQVQKQADLEEARVAHEAAPEDLEAAIWYGRRTAYLHRYHDAIKIYTDALAIHPENPKLLRHRGHRYITLREFPKAIGDLSRAAELMDGKPDEIEPDGIPNSRNEPRSTLKFNIWYHLGLAYFLNGEYSQAYSAFGECHTLASANDDLLCASTHWLYVASRRIGLHADAEALLAPINFEMDVIENQDYLDLLMLYKTHFTPEELMENSTPLSRATRGFGVGHWLLMNGDEEGAHDLFLEIIEGGMWPSFGHIACEAELSRL